MAGAVLFSLAAIFMKRAAGWRLDPWRVSCVSNLVTTLAMQPLFLLGGKDLHLQAVWQPIIVGLLFVAGQTLTVMALTYGEVSVAAPVMGLKIVLVAIFSSCLLARPLPASIWWACILATLGVGLLNVTGKASGTHVVRSIWLSFGAATVFALFDICVQAWSPGWGIGYFLPISFLASGVMSLGFIPVSRGRLTEIPAPAWSWLLAACVLMSLQSICIVATIATWGHAAEANVVYSTRGVWTILFAWLLGGVIGPLDTGMRGKTLAFRLMGALILLASIVLLLIG